MAFTTNLLAISNTVKMDGVSHLFSSSSAKPNDYLACRLSQTTTRKVKTSSCYRDKSSKTVTPVMMPETETRIDSDGIRIVRFLKGKSYLVTGATRFLARVLIEKLLRESPKIGKIFFLMKSNDQESANKRLYDEIISSELFKLLKQTHGNSYESFMKKKLIPVIGDIGKDNIGMDFETAAKISEEIDVIISCAGRTTFDDRCFICFLDLVGS